MNGARVAVGFGFLGAGIFVTYGSITGKLAPMLAALFDPKLLQPASSQAGGGIIQQLFGILGGGAIGGPLGAVAGGGQLGQDLLGPVAGSLVA